MSCPRKNIVDELQSFLFCFNSKPYVLHIPSLNKISVLLNLENLQVE